MENCDNQLKSDYSRDDHLREYDHRKREHSRRGGDLTGYPEPYRSHRGDHPHKYRRRDTYSRRDGSRSPEKHSIRGRNAFSGSVSASPDRASHDCGRRHPGAYAGAENSGNLKLYKVKKDLEYSTRDDLTVLVMNLDLDAQEFDVYEFFTTYAGNVRDIRIIRDNRTGRSKGVCYVEFYSVESVLKALKLNGQKIMNASITVQASQAEKNRVARLAKLEEIKAETTPLLLRVDGLVGLLARIRPDELDNLFSTFGKVDNIEIQVDRKTRACLGSASVLFEKAIEGHDAIKALNNFEIAGQKITVSISQENQYNIKVSSSVASSPCSAPLPAAAAGTAPKFHNEASRENPSDPSLQRRVSELDESEETLLLGPDSRNFLTKKLLARAHSKLEDAVAGQHSSRSAVSSSLAKPLSPPLDDQPGGEAVCCLLFSNMFTEQSIKESMESGETVEQVLEDIQADVEEECEKYGKLLECFLDKRRNGDVWIRYSRPEEASSARNVFHGRFFAGRRLSVSFVRDEDFPKSEGNA